MIFYPYLYYVLKNIPSKKKKRRIGTTVLNYYSTWAINNNFLI